jgi:carbon-monoxide dehydrogenase medium subunit
MPLVAHSQIRNRGTVGGSLAHADPAAELPAVMIALDATLTLVRRGASRRVRAVDFFESLFTTVLDAREILATIEAPPMPARSGAAFLELARRHGDYALAGLAAVIALDEQGVCRQARLVFINAGETPMVAGQAAQMLIGERPTEELFAEAALLASRQEIEPAADIHATAEYKRHLAHVLGKRALALATMRAQRTG